MNLRILLLKTEKLSGFLIWGSRLFHSVIVDGKKELLKIFVLTRGILCIFRVVYNKRLVRIKLNRYLGFSFSKTLYKKGKAFYTSVYLVGTPTPSLYRFFSSDVPLIAPVKASHALYWKGSSFSLNGLLKAWSYKTLP